MNILAERLGNIGQKIPMTPVLRVLQILGLVGLGWILVRGLVLMVSPESAWTALPVIPAVSSSQSGADSQSFSFSSDPFSLGTSGVEAVDISPEIDLGLDVPETKLNLVLTGRTVGGVGSAVLKTPDNMEKSYRVGEDVMNGVTLQRVASGFVVLDVRGELQRLTFARENSTGLVADRSEQIADTISVTPLTSSAEQNATPGGGLISAETMSASELMKSVKFNPHFNGGQLAGYSVSGTNGDGSLKRFGLKSGDVITKVNNTSLLNDKLNLLELASSLKTARQVKMEIIRDGRPQTVEIGR